MMQQLRSDDPVPTRDDLLQQLDAWAGHFSLVRSDFPSLTLEQAQETHGLLLEARDGIRLLLKDGEELLEGCRKAREGQ